MREMPVIHQQLDKMGVDEINKSNLCNKINRVGKTPSPRVGTTKTRGHLGKVFNHCVAVSSIVHTDNVQLLRLHQLRWIDLDDIFDSLFSPTHSVEYTWQQDLPGVHQYVVPLL
jgi:hypothetical protein